MPATRMNISSGKSTLGEAIQLDVQQVQATTNSGLAALENLETDLSKLIDPIDGVIPMETDTSSFNHVQVSAQAVTQVAGAKTTLVVSSNKSQIGEQPLGTTVQVYTKPSTQAVTTSAMPSLGLPKSPIKTGVKQPMTKMIITGVPPGSEADIQNIAAAVANQMASSGTAIGSPIKAVALPATGVMSPFKGQVFTLASPNKQQVMPGNRITVSPLKSPSKITMIPVSMATRSPIKIAPAIPAVRASATSSLVATSTGRPTAVTVAPSKIIVKQPGTQTVRQLFQSQVATSSSSGAQSSSRLQHVRLVPASSLTTSASNQTVLRPVSSALGQVPVHPFASNAGSAVTRAKGIPVSITPGGSLVVVTTASSSVVTTTTTVAATTSHINTAVTSAQKSMALTRQVPIAPAGSKQILVASAAPGKPGQVPIMSAQFKTAQSVNIPQSVLAQLPPGATLLATNQGNLQSFALVPVNQIQSQQQSTQSKPLPTQTVGSLQKTPFVPITVAAPPPMPVKAPPEQKSINGLGFESGLKPRKPCNCTKSQCLKLYCDCFANGEFCSNCNCANCYNNLEHEDERSRAIKSCLVRNPHAFHPKIGKGNARDGAERKHSKGCNCRRSGCLKNYCECYEARIMCTSTCKCIGCKNYEESPERKTLMHLADAAEVRVQQQSAANSIFSSEFPRPSAFGSSGERLPFTLITPETIEATCACLMAQGRDAERTGKSKLVTEQMILKEFGQCLMQIIQSAQRARGRVTSSSS